MKLLIQKNIKASILKINSEYSFLWTTAKEGKMDT